MILVQLVVGCVSHVHLTYRCRVLKDGECSVLCVKNEMLMKLKWFSVYKGTVLVFFHAQLVLWLRFSISYCTFYLIFKT